MEVLVEDVYVKDPRYLKGRIRQVRGTEAFDRHPGASMIGG
jgi:hypothetical protein